MKTSIRFYPMQIENEETNLLSSVAYNGIRVRFSSGISIPTKYWNKKTQQLTNSSPYELQVNEQIRQFKANIKGSIYNLETSGVTITKDVLTKIGISYSLTPNNKSKEKPNFLTNYFDSFLKFKENNGTSKGSLRFYRNVFKDFKLFEKWSKNEYKVNDIGKELMSNYINKYFLKHKGMSNAAALSYFNVLRNFFNYLKQEENLTIDESYKIKISKPEKTEKLTLTFLEVQKLITLDIQCEDLGKQRQLKLIRDRFVLGCFTALRNSDINQIRPSLKPIMDKDGNEFLILRSKKTKTTTRIPIKGITKELLERNKYDMGDYTTSLANFYIKELCQIAGITREVQKIQKRNNQEVITTQPAYKMVGSHTARRTYITLAIDGNFSSEMISNVTGHKDAKTLDLYNHSDAIKSTLTILESLEEGVMNAKSKEIA